MQIYKKIYKTLASLLFLLYREPCNLIGIVFVIVAAGVNYLRKGAIVEV